VNQLGKGTAFFSPEDLPVKNLAQSGRGRDSSVREWLADMGLRPRVFVNNPAGLPPWLRLGEAGGKMLVKMLNRNYDYREDAFAPVKGAELIIEKSFGRAPHGFLLTFPEGGPVKLRGKEVGEEFRFPLPEFPIYACLEEIE